MSFKLPHQKGSPFHQQKPQSKEEILNYYKAANEKAQLEKEQESNRLSDAEFNKQFNEGQIFQGGQDVDVGTAKRNVSKGAGFPTGASEETIKKWYANNPPQGDTISAAPDAFKSDNWLKQASTLISNPVQGLKALGNQTSYNYVKDGFGTYDTDPAFNNLTNLRKNKENRKFGTMRGDELNFAGQAGLFAASGGLAAIRGLFGLSKAPAAINAATTVAKSGKALNFLKSLKNPLTTQTYLDAASGDLTALALKKLPKVLKGKPKDLLKNISSKGYYAYKGSKIPALKDLIKSGASGAIDLGKAVANSVTPEASETGLVNAYAQMGKGMQEKATKEKALKVAKEETAIAETNRDNLITGS